MSKSTESGNTNVRLHHWLWEKIQEQFTDAEKATIKRAVIDIHQNPVGWTIDTSMLGTDLAMKLQYAMEGSFSRALLLKH